MKTLTVSLASTKNFRGQLLTLTGQYKERQFFNGISVRYCSIQVCDYSTLNDIAGLVVFAMQRMRDPSYATEENLEDMETVSNTLDKMINGNGCWLVVPAYSTTKE